MVVSSFFKKFFVSTEQQQGQKFSSSVQSSYCTEEVYSVYISIIYALFHIGLSFLCFCLLYFLTIFFLLYHCKLTNTTWKYKEIKNCAQFKVLRIHLNNYQIMNCGSRAVFAFLSNVLLCLSSFIIFYAFKTVLWLDWVKGGWFASDISRHPAGYISNLILPI